MQIRALGLPLALVAALAACDSESAPEPPPEVASNAVGAQLEAVVCDLAMECDCGWGRTFETPEQCSAWADQQQSEVDRILTTYPLTWDATCVGWYVKGFSDNGCADNSFFTSDPDGDGCNAPCLPFHGDKTAGDSCTAYEGQYSDCGQGMFCDSGVCREYCPEPAEAGESCAERPCDEMSFCNFTEVGSQICSLKATTGDDCSASECAPGLRCVIDDPTSPMPTMQCQTLASKAEPCMGHGECDTGYCPAGFCEAIPEAGDSCRGTLVCAEGLSCVEDVCGPPKKQYDSCETSCGGGLQCIEGVCLGVNAAACYPGNPI